MQTRPSAVFDQVWEDGVARYGRVNTLFHGVGAYDLPTFLSRAMTSNDLSIGRLFAKPEEVKAALRGKRTAALTDRVLFADTTGEMSLAKFEAAFEKPARSFKRDREFGRSASKKVKVESSATGPRLTK